MTQAPEHPWASGPGELLKHGLDLLRKDSDVHRRLAMISIDNAVELMIKVFLGLPRRVTGLSISRKEYQEFSESFPLLLDALEKHAAARLNGVELGDVEWYHRLRNQLYHQGNGLTVERDKVAVYSEVAKTLYANLFGSPLAVPTSPDTALLGEFLAAWVSLERALMFLASSRGVTPKGFAGLGVAEVLHREGVVSKVHLADLQAIREVRNQVVHGQVSYQGAVTPELVNRVHEVTSALEEAAKRQKPPEAAT
jgi:hypothetical protein